MDRAASMPIPHPGQFAPGDQVTHHGHVAIRGRRTWWWTNDTWLGRHLVNRWSDELMDEFLACEHPYARITHLNPDRSGR